MLGLFAQAESETLSTNTNAALVSLGKLVAGGQSANVNMPLYLEELSNSVLNPSPGDATFLAEYYTTYPTPGIPTVTINGVSYFGYSMAPPGVGWAAETSAPVNQWLLGSVHPDDAVCAELNDGNGVAESAYSPPSGSLSLFGPSGVPFVTDVSQGNVGDCWLMASLADVAYRCPGDIENMFIAHDNGTYTVCLYVFVNGQPSPEYVTVERPASERRRHVRARAERRPLAGIAEKAFCEAYGTETVPYVMLGSPPLWVSQYSYEYLEGSGPNPNAGNPQFPLAAITGLPPSGGSFGYIGLAHASDVINALNNDQFVGVCTGGSTSFVLAPSHCYAVLSYDPSTDEFLLYNPWGIGAVASLSASVSNNTATIPVVWPNGSTGIATNDVIQIDDEEMLVTHVAINTLTVERGYDGTTASAHGVTASISLCFANGSPFAGAPILSGNTAPGEPFTYGLFTETGSFLDHNFDTWGDTSSAAITPQTVNTETPSPSLPYEGMATLSVITLAESLGESDSATKPLATRTGISHPVVRLDIGGGRQRIADRTAPDGLTHSQGQLLDADDGQPGSDGLATLMGLNPAIDPLTPKRSQRSKGTTVSLKSPSASAHAVSHAAGLFTRSLSFHGLGEGTGKRTRGW